MSLESMARSAAAAVVTSSVRGVSGLVSGRSGARASAWLSLATASWGLVISSRSACSPLPAWFAWAIWLASSGISVFAKLARVTSTCGA